MSVSRSALLPLRRFFQSAACSRFSQSATSRVDTPSQQGLAEEENASTPPAGEYPADELQRLVSGVSAQNDYTSGQPSSRQFITAFKNQAFVRPVDMRKEFHMWQSKKPQPLRVAPGREARRTDPFLQLGIDPRDEVENVRLMGDFTTRMGKIYPRTSTLLTQRSQRLLGKAIKRAKMMGVIPRLSNLKYADVSRISK